MLEGLEKIDWSALDHAYGKAGDVPGLLRGLLAEDEDTRREALYELCGTIWHQGTVYEASSFAVPFLLKMLRSPDTPDKAGIAMLVAELADGTAPLEPYGDPDDEMSHLLRATLAKEGRDFDRELREGRAWVRSTREAVGLGLELLLPYLQHSEPEVRAAVARALSRFPERAKDTVPLLEQALRSEREDYVTETLKSSLAELEGRR